MNQAAEELIACRLDDARGRPLSSLLTLIDQDTGQEQAICPGRLGASGTGATGARSKLVLHAADRATPVSVVGAELGLEGAPAGMVVVIHD
ncbi:UNVERIFIED_CONTAM: hypothetical protein NY603_24705, partial [Bacteroidetes bacterium 56_B9]